MAIQPVPALVLASEFPTNADRTAGVWNAKAQGWANSENAMVTRAHEIAEVTHNNATDAQESAVAANTSRQQAQQARDDARASAVNAGDSAAVVGRWDRLVLGPKSNFPTVDNDGQPLQVGAEFYHTVLKGRYSWSGTEWRIGTNVTAGVESVNGNTGPAVVLGIADVVEPGDIVAYGSTKEEARNKIDATNGVIRRTERAASQQLTAQDLAHLIDITSGTFTQTFAAPTTLGSGWWCYLRNSGTGAVTMQAPVGSTIDGLASYIMYPGECRLIQCDGVVLRTMVITPLRIVMRESFDFLKPPGYREWRFDWRGATAGGGSGGSGHRTNGTGGNSHGGGGGGSGGVGGRAWGKFIDALIPALLSITVGAKGIGGAAVSTPMTVNSPGKNGENGTDGGATGCVIDGITITALGGLGGGLGRGASTSASGSAGLAGSGGNAQISNPSEGGTAATRYDVRGHAGVVGRVGLAGGNTGMGPQTAPGGDGGIGTSNSLGAGPSGDGGAGGRSMRDLVDDPVSVAGSDGVPGMCIIEGVL